MEDLTQNRSRLTLSEREGPRCCLTNEKSSLDFSIGAKFLTKRALNVDVCWGLFFCPTWHYFISNPCHINILLIFWEISLKSKINLYLMDWPHIAHKILTSSIGIHGPHFLFINWDHNPMTSSTSTYGSGSSNESKFMAHITSLTLIASSFFNKSPYLRKMTTKPKVHHLIFGL